MTLYHHPTLHAMTTTAPTRFTAVATTLQSPHNDVAARHSGTAVTSCRSKMMSPWWKAEKTKLHLIGFALMDFRWIWAWLIGFA